MTYRTMSEVYAYAEEFTIRCKRCGVGITNMDDSNPKGGYALSGTGKPKVINRWNTRATDPLLEKMARALERIAQWDWTAILSYSECYKEVYEDLENAAKTLQKYQEATCQQEKK